MKCNNCGFEFDEGIFCPECGTKYTEAVSISSQTAQNVQMVKNENVAVLVNNQKTKEKKDKTPGVVLTLGIISILTGWMIIGIVPAIIAIIKGIKGLKKNKNDSRIIAGMVCSGITIAFLILVFVCDAIDNHKTKIIADYMDNQQYAEALEYMDEKSWGTRYNKFDCYVGLGQYDEAADIILNYVNGIEDEAKLVEKSTAEIEKLESIYDLVSDDKRIEIDVFEQKVSDTKAKLEKEQEEAEAKEKEESETKTETTKPETKEQDETVVESDEVFESLNITEKEPLFSVYVDATSGYVDLRKGSSESYEVLTQIPSDTVLVVYDYSSDTEEWYEVEYEGNVGWIPSGQTMIIPELRDDITQYESEETEDFNESTDNGVSVISTAGYDVSKWAVLDEYDNELLFGNNGYSLWKLKDNLGLYLADGGCVAFTTQLDSIEIDNALYGRYNDISNIPDDIFEIVGRVFFIEQGTYGIWGFGNGGVKIVATFNFDGTKIENLSIIDSNNDVGNKYEGNYTAVVEPLHMVEIYIHNKGKNPIKYDNNWGQIKVYPDDRASSGYELLPLGNNKIDIYEIKGNEIKGNTKTKKIKTLEIELSAAELKRDFCYIVEKSTFGGYSFKKVDKYDDLNVDIHLKDSLVPRDTPLNEDTVKEVFRGRVISINDVPGAELILFMNGGYREVYCSDGGMRYGNTSLLYDGSYWTLLYD